ncbi:tetratricopeptide repeat protein [Rhodomicrobium vannielii]|uniref:tetratricopeptide repeat protein n=1 Tax=Rhodomicrobium vannielii TaxID=1069 RepID=UPI0001C26189|nr:tetratricopeptide repeat protein [Rhodomicrobium vannielii]
MRALFLALALMVAGCCAALADAVADCNQQKDRDLSIRGCTLIIDRKAKGDRALAYHWRGYNYKNKGDYDRAIVDLNEAIRLDPKDAKAYSNRGDAYDNKGEYDRAIADHSEAIRLDPKNSNAYTHRGNAYRDKGEYGRAIADFNEAIFLDPQYAFTYYNRGNAYRDKSDYDRAIADYDEAIRLYPAMAYAYGGRSHAMFKTGKLEAAMADIDKAISLDKQLAFFFYRRGHIHLASGGKDSALADFNEALRLESGAVSALSGRGQVYEAQGKKDLAVADYRKAIDGKAADREDRDAQDTARERLAALEQSAKVAAAPPVAPVAPAMTTSAPAASQTRPLGRRVALVIGNADYRALSRLGNPVGDARRVASELRANGYDVLDGYDLTRERFLDKLETFRQSHLRGATEIFVFYAGHGMSIGGRDVLAPIDLAYVSGDTANCPLTT